MSQVYLTAAAQNERVLSFRPIVEFAKILSFVNTALPEKKKKNKENGHLMKFPHKLPPPQ